MSSVLIASLSSAGIALALAALLILASKIFRVDIDERVETVISMLPGVNCGGCGFPGCSPFGKALAADKAPINGCPVGGAPLAEKLAKYLGKEVVEPAEKIRAYIFCHGHKDFAKTKQDYVGAQSCVGAAMAGGNKDCSYGCVGYLDCLRSCAFDAIIETEDGVPAIVEDKCVACNACVKACPLNLIEMHPVNQKVHVYCKSLDKGAIAKKACDKACIACNICVKNTKEGGMHVDKYLAIINYDDYSITEESFTKCPTKAITDERVNVV